MNTLLCCPKFWKLVSSAVDLYQLPFCLSQTCLQIKTQSFRKHILEDALKRLSKLLPAIANLMLFGKTKNNGISLQRKCFPFLSNSFRIGILNFASLTLIIFPSAFTLRILKCSLGHSQVRSKAYRAYWTLRSEYQMTAETKVKDKLKNR